MDEDVILSLFALYHSEQYCYSHLLWFKFVTLTMQTCIIGQGHNMKGTKGELTSDHTMSKTNPFHQPTTNT